MSRPDEIAQGLREPGGSLIGGLHAEDYVRGIEDFKAGRLPPKGLTSTSYDLGRARAREIAEREFSVMAEIKRRQCESHRAVRRIIIESGRLDVLAEYDAKMAAINVPKASQSGTQQAPTRPRRG